MTADHQPASGPSPKRCTDTVPVLDIRALERDDALGGGVVHVRAWHTAHGLLALRWWLRDDCLVVAPGQAQDPVVPGTLTYVPLLRTSCEVTAVRRWFGCPACGRRVATLYADGFLACRRCHGLVYRSQRETGRGRARRDLERLRERLGWACLPSVARGARPARMHRRTFARLLALHEALVARAGLVMSPAGSEVSSSTPPASSVRPR